MSVKENMLEILEGIDIRFKEPLHSYSYTKVGGEADYLVFPRNRFELSRLLVGISLIRTPSSMISPVVASSKPAMMFRMVDFPEPDAPRRV